MCNSFDLYQCDPNTLKEFGRVETGLSPGECRQSLLERFCEDLKHGNIVEVNDNLTKRYHTELNCHISLNAGMAIIEEIIYEDTADHELLGNWFFCNETIKVVETQ